MLRNQVYRLVRKYLEELLFGFDKDQLEISLLSGQLNLKHVNLRPDKSNQLLEELKLPVALKAGMISRLHIQVVLPANPAAAPALCLEQPHRA